MGCWIVRIARREATEPNASQHSPRATGVPLPAGGYRQACALLSVPVWRPGRGARHRRNGPGCTDTHSGRGMPRPVHPHLSDCRPCPPIPRTPSTSDGPKGCHTPEDGDRADRRRWGHGSSARRPLLLRPGYLAAKAIPTPVSLPFPSARPGQLLVVFGWCRSQGVRKFAIPPPPPPPRSFRIPACSPTALRAA